MKKEEKEKKKGKRRKKVEKKKNYSKVLIIIGVIIFILWIIVKLLFIHVYNTVNNDAYSKLIKNYANQINYTYSSKKLEDNEYIKHGNIKIKNYLDDSFESKPMQNYDKSDGISFYSKEHKSMLNIGEYHSYTGMYKEDFTYFLGEGSFFNNIFFANDNAKSRKKFLEKNNINNDIELFNFVGDMSNKKVNIFTPIYKIRQMGSLALFASTAFPAVDKIAILDGKYDGYVFVIKEKFREIHIFYDDKNYIIGVLGEYFTDEMYKEIISTIVIE